MIINSWWIYLSLLKCLIIIRPKICTIENFKLEYQFITSNIDNKCYIECYIECYIDMDIDIDIDNNYIEELFFWFDFQKKKSKQKSKLRRVCWAKFGFAGVTETLLFWSWFVSIVGWVKLWRKKK